MNFLKCRIKLNTTINETHNGIRNIMKQNFNLSYNVIRIKIGVGNYRNQYGKFKNDIGEFVLSSFNKIELKKNISI